MRCVERSMEPFQGSESERTRKMRLGSILVAVKTLFTKESITQREIESVNAFTPWSAQIPIGFSSWLERGSI